MKEIKQFIESLKAETFGGFSRPNLQSLIPGKVNARLRNTLCKSVALDHSSTIQPKDHKDSSIFFKETATGQSVLSPSTIDQQQRHSSKESYGNRLSKFVANMDSTVSNYKSKILDSFQDIQLNRQSGNLESALQQQQRTVQDSRSHRQIVEKERAIQKLLNKVNTQLISKSKLQKDESGAFANFTTRNNIFPAATSIKRNIRYEVGHSLDLTSLQIQSPKAFMGSASGALTLPKLHKDGSQAFTKHSRDLPMSTLFLETGESESKTEDQQKD